MALDRSLLGGAVLDYNVTTTLNKFSSEGTSYTFTGGGEVAGGDIQGSLVGASGQSASVSDLHWRYVVREIIILARSRQVKLRPAATLFRG